MNKLCVQYLDLTNDEKIEINKLFFIHNITSNKYEILGKKDILYYAAYYPLIYYKIIMILSVYFELVK